MKFQNWLELNESNLQSLYTNTVKAFPYTTKRQFATDTIKIAEMVWTPFLGVKTLFVKGLAQNQGKEYNPMILFKKVEYYDSKNEKNWVEITANDGKNYIFEKINDENDVLVRCNCPDFRFRFNFYDHIDKSLFGKKVKKYESLGIGPPANPQELPGMCKHIIKLIKSLGKAGILEE